MVSLSLYPYQQRVMDLLHSGRSVVLQAPTGCGKTLAALAPFMRAFSHFPPEAFPQQCLYAVPMRVLANQFEREYRELAKWQEESAGRSPQVTIQTGERADDPKLLGDLIFTTIDQVLSSALSVPYSLSQGQSNINVAAVWGSYLVFDEFHLFPHEARNTTLQLLKTFGCFAPFALMTATFSRPLLEEAAESLGAEAVLLEEREIEAIETRGGLPRKERHFRVVPQSITAEAVLAKHEGRSLVVCNTVDRAIGTYEALVQAGCRPIPFSAADLAPLYASLRSSRNAQEHQCLLDRAIDAVRERHLSATASEPWLMLLHSRFESPHRQVKEGLLRVLWGPSADLRQASPSLIVVATQVVEVGLDISSNVLHTEMAPAASILQRAGRCARYPGERGYVYVYQVPLKKDGEPDYAPYAQSHTERAICERTWQALQARHDTVVRFADELEIVDTAHGEADRESLRHMHQEQGRIWECITQAVVFRDASVRRDLIRPLESRTLLVHEPPEGLTEESPFRFEGFSLWHGTLRGRLGELWERAETLGLPWALRYAIVCRDEEDSQSPVAYRWLDARNTDDISAALVFALHPALAEYDAERGLRLGVAGDGSYRSPEAVRRGRSWDYEGYQLESYQEHAGALCQVFERLFRARLRWLERRFGYAPENEAVVAPLGQAVLLVLALHDVGKLDGRWQLWAERYQQAIGEGKPPFLVAHTHWQPQNPVHRAAERTVKPRRPPHAGEGAHAVARILWEVLGKQHKGLYRAAVTAIARHHDAGLDEARPYHLHTQARETVAETLAGLGRAEWRKWAEWLIQASEAPNLQKHLLRPWPEDSWADWLMYFAIVRYLRLCDGLSQEVSG